MPVELAEHRNDGIAVIQCRAALIERSEQSLLACAKKGDPAAFENLVTPYRETILRLAQRILRNPEDAEDVLQTSLLQAFRHLDRFEGRARFSTWLFCIARNEALMKLRAHRAKCETSLDQLVESDEAPAKLQVIETRPNPEEDCSAREIRAMLDKALDRLGPLYKEVLHLRDVQELTAREAAEILEVPVGTVKARLHRARFKLTRTVRSMIAPKRKPTTAGSQRLATLMSQEAKLA